MTTVDRVVRASPRAHDCRSARSRSRLGNCSLGRGIRHPATGHRPPKRIVGSWEMKSWEMKSWLRGRFLSNALSQDEQDDCTSLVSAKKGAVDGSSCLPD
jgi:hypothetical protein